MAAIATGRRGFIQWRRYRLRDARSGGHRLPVAARHAIIAGIDSIRARQAVIALDGHNLYMCRRALAIMTATNSTLVINARAKTER
ncbi:MAG: hypothetical protein WCF81_05150 [Roseiarcus sp.]